MHLNKLWIRNFLKNIKGKHYLAALKKVKLLSDFNPLSKGIVALPTCFDKNPF